jgi:manganese/iron transport system ATP-binding protein
VSGIDVRHLTVSYGSNTVVHDVSFAVPPGRVTGLIGPNGAGKSTVVRSVLGLQAPDAGTIRLDGERMRNDRGRRVAYLPQRLQLDPDYPIQVRELVRMGRVPHRGLLRPMRSIDRLAVDRAIERVGLTGLERRPLGTLSGGEQQRAHFARSLAQEPQAYVLDEPFTGVDAPTVDLLIAVIKRLAAHGAAVLLVNHDLEQVEVLCDRLVVLNRRVFANGPAAAVLDGPMVALAYDHREPAGLGASS